MSAGAAVLKGDPEDLQGLIAGRKSAWDDFVVRYSGLVVAAVRRAAGDRGDPEDIVQEVFLRLCKDEFRLLRQYDATRASISTWLTIVARSVTHDVLRRRQAVTQPIDATPEAAFAVSPEIHETIKVPEGLLSPRQQLVLTMLYQRDLEVGEVAKVLNVDPQTVRSTHHKAMLKLRAHFRHN